MSRPGIELQMYAYKENASPIKLSRPTMDRYFSHSDRVLKEHEMK